MFYFVAWGFLFLKLPKLNVMSISTEMQEAQGTGNPGESYTRRQPKVEEQGEANT